MFRPQPTLPRAEIKEAGYPQGDIDGEEQSARAAGAGVTSQAWQGALPWLAGLVLGGGAALALDAMGAGRWLAHLWSVAWPCCWAWSVLRWRAAVGSLVAMRWSTGSAAKLITS
jgi:hypothetical protein